MLSEPVPLCPEDLQGCLLLSREVNWNQNHADWTFILTHGVVFGIKRDGRLVATAGIMPYGSRFGWVCMVIVTAPERRRGLAEALLRECLDRLNMRGAVAGLDATPAGREVYRKLGFCDVYPITRLERRGDGRQDSTEDGLPIHAMSADRLNAVADYDLPRFGEARAHLLSIWLQRVPQAAHYAATSSGITGFVLAREGREAMQIGPIVADDQKIALALLEASLKSISGPAFIDVPDHHQELQEWLQRRGFQTQRRFTRMLLGRSVPLDRPGQVMAITGAEFG
jgi:hypothetical protein